MADHGGVSAPEVQPPDGFRPSRGRGPYSTHNGPFFDREQDGRLERGFYVLSRHCNSFGIMHGGMVCTFLDGLLAAQAWRASGRMGVTIQLSTDFLSAARQGDWVQGDAHVTKVAGELVFVEGRAVSRGRDLARAHAIFKLMSPRRSV